MGKKLIVFQKEKSKSGFIIFSRNFNPEDLSMQNI